MASSASGLVATWSAAGVGERTTLLALPVAFLAVFYAWPFVTLLARGLTAGAVGDTLGPGGVFRFLRTGPQVIDICRDMEELCPRALFINYSNPMNINMWAVSRASPGIMNVGLCHSVQRTAADLADWLVSKAAVPFREAHGIVGRAVGNGHGRKAGVGDDFVDPVADLLVAP